VRLVAALVALVALAAAPAHAGVTYRSVESGGLERSYRLFAPGGLGSSPAPVVLVFHGYGQSVAGLVRSTGFDAVAAREGFLAVYPESVGPGWNAGSCCGFAPRADVDDLGFVDDLLADLRGSFRLDSRRIYATGISNGGIFSYRLACKRARAIAAVAPVAATMDTPCEPAEPVSVLHLHGLDDRVLPFEGGAGIGRDVDWPPVREAIGFWRKRDGCGHATTRRAGAVAVESSRCDAGTAVTLVTVDGVGHAWPEEPLDATRTIWRFFQAHPDGGE
jgi:polyhydroxybutyrate depolymerase